MASKNALLLSAGNTFEESERGYYIWRLYKDKPLSKL